MQVFWVSEPCHSQISRLECGSIPNRTKFTSSLKEVRRSNESLCILLMIEDQLEGEVSKTLRIGEVVSFSKFMRDGSE